MEAINLNTKENIINSYGVKPTLFYDIEGVLVENHGRDVKIEKMVEDRKILYSIKVKEEINFQKGDRVLIDKENILSLKVEEESKEENLVNTEEVIKRLGLEDTEETLAGIKHLVENQIPVTKENLESFLISKRYLKEIVEGIDFDSCIKLLDNGIDLKEDSLQKIAKALSQIKNEKKDLSLKELFKLDRKLSYKEAERIGKEIYGRKMGKDVYDSIIALHKENIPINKENIEKVMEITGKLYDLKDYKDETFVKVFKDELPINIENLYKVKHSYNNGVIDKNITSSIFEQFTIEKEGSLKDRLKLLKEMDIDQNEQNIKLLREFLINGVELTKENFEKILEMKVNLKELTKILDEEKAALLIEEGIDPLKEDISNLIDRIKKLDTEKETDLDRTTPILKELESLKYITDRQLLEIIKSGEDFKIENIKELGDTNINLDKGLNGKTVGKAITINNIFNTLGDLGSETIALAVKRYNTITLNNLYDSYKELVRAEELVVKPITQIEESIIRQEYLNARANTTINLIEESIKDGIDLEHMAIEELNQYIDKKVNRYKDTQRLVNEIKYLKGKEETIIPMIIKNQLNMSINQINNIDSILDSGKGIGSVFHSFIKKQNHNQHKDVKEGIEILQDKIKEFSYSLRKGDENVKTGYRNVLDNFTNLSNAFNSQEENKDENMKQIEEYLKLQKSLSKDDLILQLPISTKDGYNNMNLIIPDIKKGIDKNNMVFYLNIETENLGQVRFNLQVKDNRIYIDFNTENNENILKNRQILVDGLNKIGYVLEEIKPNYKT